MRNWPTQRASLFPPPCRKADGHQPVKVASRFGTLGLSRQILVLQDGRHVLPGNALLPAHEGMMIPRGRQEWACLLPQDLPFAPVARLLGWQNRDDALLCPTTLRNLVRRHGPIVRQAEADQVQARLERTDRVTLTPPWVVASREPRRRAAWPQALGEAVDTALIAGATRPPDGVSPADWERVLFVRRQEAHRSVTDLRHLGPTVEPDEVLATVDEVLTRQPQKRCFWELRTARIVTSEGTRYVSGTGEAFLLLLTVFLQVCLGQPRHLLVIADGARWIRAWYASLASLRLPSCLLLDWYHLCHTCTEMASLICRGRCAKTPLLKVVIGCLWQGQVAEAIAALEAHRPAAKNVEKLDELIGYLQVRSPYIPNYRARRRECRYIGSGHVEKTNDLLVAQRQKGQGMHWSLETSDALAALRTLMLNGGWERYWCHREVLPLVGG